MATIRDIRRAVQVPLDDGQVLTVTSATSSTIVASILANATSSPAPSTSRFNQRWLYVANGLGFGQQRAVQTGGYTTASGTLTIYPVFTVTPSAADEVELTNLFPCISPPGETSYLGLIREALRKLAIERYIDVTTVANQREYSLGTTYAAWLTDERRLIGVYDPPRSVTAPALPTWRRYALKIDGHGQTATLQFLDRGYDVSGKTFRLRVRKPAFYEVTNAESATGPTLDTHDISLPIGHVVTATLAEAYQALAQRTPGLPTDPKAADKAKYWQAETQKLASYDTLRERQQAPEPAAQAVA